MRYLALDLGTKTLGLAISDKSNVLVSPLPTIKFKEAQYQELIESLRKIITEYEITQIVLGLPKNMDNSLGMAAQRSLDFQQILLENFSLPVTLIDERLTSVEGHNILLKMGKKNQERKKIIDGVAASIILEQYLKMKGKKL